MPPNEAPASTLPASTLTVATAVLAFDGHSSHSSKRTIPVEAGISIVYSGIPFAVMMATPSDLEDFGIGFSLTEGIITVAGDVRGIRVEQDANGLRLEIDLSAERLRLQLGRRRAMTGRTSCGVCGVEDLAALTQVTKAVAEAPRIRLSAIERALGELDQLQKLNAITHAVHGAAWADFDGTILRLREDVGRHNALDKLIGALIRGGTDPQAGMMVITSRCSFEMVEKTAAFGAATIIAISAPTSLAIERARSLGITLIALARHDSITLFEGRDRVEDDIIATAENVA